MSTIQQNEPSVLIIVSINIRKKTRELDVVNPVASDKINPLKRDLLQNDKKKLYTYSSDYYNESCFHPVCCYEFTSQLFCNTYG